MSRGKWIIAFLCVPAALLGAALLRSGHISGRLQAEGVETKAVLTGSSSRAEFVGYRPRSRRYRGKHTVCYFDYRYVVGGQTYTGKVRKKREPPYGPHRRFGRGALPARRPRRAPARDRFGGTLRGRPPCPRTFP